MKRITERADNMTKEELRKHCEKQIEQCKLWAESRGEQPSGHVYEEHLLILELLKQEPCEDAISRKEVADIINRQRFGIQKISWDIIKEKLEVLPSVIPTREHGKWIPVSEKLPETEYENYLVSTKEGDVDIGTYDRESGWSMCDANGIYCPQYKGIEIVAWMPLPEPYTEKGAE